MMGRLVHYAADALMVSTIIAGVKRSSGVTIDTTRVSEPNMRNALQYYLAAGEYVFDKTLSIAQSSQYFRPAEPVNPLSLFNQEALTSLRQYSHPESQPRW